MSRKQISRTETFREPTTETGLDPKRERFCQEYVNGPYVGNGARSAIAAGMGETYYSSAELASQALKTVEVRRRVAQLLAERGVRLIATEDRVLEEYGKLAFSDIGEVMDFDVSGAPAVKDSSTIPAHARQALRKVKRTTRSIGGMVMEEKVEFELHDKKAALDKLGEHLGMFRENAGQTVNVFVIEVPERLNERGWAEKYQRIAAG